MRISDKQRELRINAILQLTENWIPLVEISESMGEYRDTTYKFCNSMVENNLLETKLVKGKLKGKNKQATHFRMFRRVVDVTNIFVLPKQDVKPSLADGVYRHDMDDNEDKYRQQSELARREYKSPRVYVGCHDGI